MTPPDDCIAATMPPLRATPGELVVERCQGFRFAERDGGYGDIDFREPAACAGSGR